MKGNGPHDDAAPPEEATRTRLKRSYEAALRLSATDPGGAAEALRELLPQCEGSARVHFLVLSNLARLAAPEDPNESLRLLLEAGLLQCRAGRVGADVLLRIAHAASRTGDSWTTKWALLQYAQDGGLPNAAVSMIMDHPKIPHFEAAAPPLKRASRLGNLPPLQTVAGEQPAPPHRPHPSAAPARGAGAEAGLISRSSRPSRGRLSSRRPLGIRDLEATFPERVLVCLESRPFVYR